MPCLVAATALRGLGDLLVGERGVRSTEGDLTGDELLLARARAGCGVVELGTGDLLLVDGTEEVHGLLLRRGTLCGQRSGGTGQALDGGGAFSAAGGGGVSGLGAGGRCERDDGDATEKGGATGTVADHCGIPPWVWLGCSRQLSLVMPRKGTSRRKNEPHRPAGAGVWSACLIHQARGRRCPGRALSVNGRLIRTESCGNYRGDPPLFPAHH